jgi:hypothetical protein
MARRYIHLFGNAACEDILGAYGLVSKDQQNVNVLQSKQCPNCNEPNKPDSKFCAKCRIVLMTYNAYTETLEDQKEKEDELQTIKEQFNNMQSQLQTLITALGSIRDQTQITALGSIRDQTQINQTAQILYKSGILNSS